MIARKPSIHLDAVDGQRIRKDPAPAALCSAQHVATVHAMQCSAAHAAAYAGEVSSRSQPCVEVIQPSTMQSKN
jgi:hypothetical protein